jgi:hypothetical protein
MGATNSVRHKSPVAMDLRAKTSPNLRALAAIACSYVRGTGWTLVLLFRLGIATLLWHDLYLMEHEIAVEYRRHDLVPGLHFLEDHRIVDFVVHGHGRHPALNLLAIDFQALAVCINGFDFAVERV